MRAPKAQHIGELAYKALLREAEATPKPGLVDRCNNGAHRDMDLALFCRSAAAIEPWFSLFYQSGRDGGYGIQEQLNAIRPIGQRAEKDMLQATGGVNTHKGAIFTLGVLCCCCGRLVAREETLAPKTVCKEAGSICLGIERELTDSAADTHGARCYRAYGSLGIRGEAAKGFPSVLAFGLPGLERTDLPENTRLLVSLMALMAHVDDTTVLSRTGRAGADYCQGEAAALLAACPPEGPDFLPALARLDRDFTARNISPGGCADLLAAAWFLKAAAE